MSIQGKSLFVGTQQLRWGFQGILSPLWGLEVPMPPQPGLRVQGLMPMAAHVHLLGSRPEPVT